MVPLIPDSRETKPKEERVRMPQRRLSNQTRGFATLQPSAVGSPRAWHRREAWEKERRTNSNHVRTAKDLVDESGGAWRDCGWSIEGFEGGTAILLGEGFQYSRPLIAFNQIKQSSEKQFCK